jgi:hypothetical protein
MLAHCSEHDAVHYAVLPAVACALMQLAVNTGCAPGCRQYGCMLVVCNVYNVYTVCTHTALQHYKPLREYTHPYAL